MEAATSPSRRRRLHRRRTASSEDFARTRASRTSKLSLRGFQGCAGRRPARYHNRNFARTIAVATPIATPRGALKTAHFWTLRALAACGPASAPLRAATVGSAPQSRLMAKPKSRSKSALAKAPAAGDADVLARIADALERLAPQRAAPPEFDSADAFVWQPDGRRLMPVKRVNRVQMSLLKGIDRVRDVLVENTERFAKGLPANNALLWGARGMGKSSLVKAAHAGVNATLARNAKSGPLKLIEIHREDIQSL